MAYHDTCLVMQASPGLATRLGTTGERIWEVLQFRIPPRPELAGPRARCQPNALAEIRNRPHQIAGVPRPRAAGAHTCSTQNGRPHDTSAQVVSLHLGCGKDSEDLHSLHFGAVFPRTLGRCSPFPPHGASSCGPSTASRTRTHASGLGRRVFAEGGRRGGGLAAGNRRECPARLMLHQVASTMCLATPPRHQQQDSSQLQDPFMQGGNMRSPDKYTVPVAMLANLPPLAFFGIYAKTGEGTVCLLGTRPLMESTWSPHGPPCPIHLSGKRHWSKGVSKYEILPSWHRGLSFHCPKAGHRHNAGSEMT